MNLPEISHARPHDNIRPVYRKEGNRWVQPTEEQVRSEVTTLGEWWTAEVPAIPNGWRRLRNDERIVFGDSLWNGTNFQPILAKGLILFFPTPRDVVIRPDYLHSAYPILAWRWARVKYRERIEKLSNVELVKHFNKATANLPDDIMEMLRREVARRGILPG